MRSSLSCRVTPTAPAFWATTTSRVLTLEHVDEPQVAVLDELRGIEQLSQVFSDRDSRLALDGATEDVITGNFYQALRHLRTLLPREARLFAQMS